MLYLILQMRPTSTNSKLTVKRLTKEIGKNGSNCLLTKFQSQALLRNLLRPIKKELLSKLKKQVRD